MKQIQTKKLVISNVERDSDKSMKIAAWEQANRDWKRIIDKTKEDAENWSGM